MTAPDSFTPPPPPTPLPSTPPPDATDHVLTRRLPRSEPPATGHPDHRCAAGAPRRRGGALSASRPGPHSGRSPSPRPVSDPDGAALAAAARMFADRCLRLILEAIDRRRPVSTVTPLLSPAVAGMISALSTASVPGRSRGGAVVRTVHVRLVGDTAAEVFGTYARGDRVFAVAAHLTARRGVSPSESRLSTRSAPARGAAWTMTSLRLS